MGLEVATPTLAAFELTVALLVASLIAVLVVSGMVLEIAAPTLAVFELVVALLVASLIAVLV